MYRFFFFFRLRRRLSISHRIILCTLCGHCAQSLICIYNSTSTYMGFYDITGQYVRAPMKQMRSGHELLDTCTYAANYCVGACARARATPTCTARTHSCIQRVLGCAGSPFRWVSVPIWIKRENEKMLWFSGMARHPTKISIFIILSVKLASLLLSCSFFFFFHFLIRRE